MRVLIWKKRRLCKCCLTITCSVVVFGVLFVYYQLKNMECKDEKSRKLIKNLCVSYRNGEVNGNICDDLCTTKKLKFKKCTNYDGGKHVLIMDWYNVPRTDPVPAVLKTGKHHKEGFHMLREFGINKQDNDLDFPLDDFIKMVAESLQMNLGIPIKKEFGLLNRIYSLDFNESIALTRKKNPHPKRTVMEDIWALTQQDEFMLMRLFQNSKVFPQIYGTCGHTYLLEFTPPGEYLGKHLNFRSLALKEPTKTEWRKRAKIALGILDLIHSFKVKLPQEFNLCDTKGENFGISRDGTVKFIDLDMTFFDSKLATELNVTENCTTHKDCDFFDCKGWCDMTERTCTSNRINNNLQIVCNDIFLSRADNTFSGLLENPPRKIRLKLSHLLMECSNPGKTQHKDIRYKASEETFQKLHHLLVNSLS